MAEFLRDYCSSAKCGAAIIWAISATTGSPQPIDFAPSADGTVKLTERPGEAPLATVIRNPADRFGKQLRLAHHASCPDAARWRGGKR
jgi:hypothetical protein